MVYIKMDFNAYRRQLILDNIINTNLQTQQYERDILKNFVTNQPIMKPIAPPMPFLSSHTNPDRYEYGGYQYNHLTGAGLAEDDAIRNILKRNEMIKAQNMAELQADESGTFDTQEEADDSSQKQSLELYFNELQDGGFGGTDINRENTRKALFNLKAIGLDLNLQTIQRYEKIVNEFIDSFVLSVQNPQFSEILDVGTQTIKPKQRIEILKASLRNLDSIENVLRILKVLDMLEETYNIQDIQREPIFEARFNDIIEAKPTQYIPDNLRALLTRANKTFEQIKDKLQGIQDIRGDVKDKSDRIKSDKPKLTEVFERLTNGFKQLFTKTATKVFNTVRANYKPENQEAVLDKKLSRKKFRNNLKAFFKTVKVRDLIAQNMSNFTLSASARQALLRLVNGQGDVETNIKSVSKDFETMLQNVYKTVSDEFKDKLDPQEQAPIPQAPKPQAPPQPPQQPPLVPFIPAPAQRKPQTPQTAPLPKETPTEKQFLEQDDLLEKMRKNMTPVGKVHPKAKLSNITPTTDLKQAQEQLKDAKTLLKKKKNASKNVKAQQKTLVQNAQRIVDSIIQNEKFKKQRAKADDVKKQLDFGQDGRAMPKDAEDEEREIQEAEEQAKAQALAQAQEQLARAQEAEQEEQKGQGRRVRKTHGGKKTATIDKEHRTRLKALLM